MTRGEWTAAIVAGLGFVGIGVFAVTRRSKSAPGDSYYDEDLEAMARAIASEAGGEPREIQIAIGWAIQNESIRKGKTIFATIAPTGEFGSQSGGGYVSSARAATAATREVARLVLAGDVDDPTGGATQFDSPRAQRALLAQGKPGYKKTPEEVAAARRADGKTMVLLPGVPEDRIRFWKKA